MTSEGLGGAGKEILLPPEVFLVNLLPDMMQVVDKVKKRGTGGSAYIEERGRGKGNDQLQRSAHK